MEIAGEDQKNYVTFQDFSVYEMVHSIEEN